MAPSSSTLARNDFVDVDQIEFDRAHGRGPSRLSNVRGRPALVGASLEKGSPDRKLSAVDFIQDSPRALPELELQSCLPGCPRSWLSAKRV